MSVTVMTIVEGDGEVGALPVLLRRMGAWLTPDCHIAVPPPIRVRRDQFLNRAEVFSRQLKLAALKCGQPGWLLIVLDADDDCPKELAATIRERAALVVPGLHVSVVIPKREYEAWFIAAAASLDGKRGFRADASMPEPESIRGAKEWLGERMGAKRYGPVIDQPAFSALFDLPLARERSRSFRKLCTDWEHAIGLLRPHAAP